MRKLLIPLLALSMGFAQTISPLLYGQNSWMPYAYGSQVYYGQLDNLWEKVRVSHVRLVRIGGIAPDDNIPTQAQYLALVDSIKRIGAEPVVQVSHSVTAQAATDLITYLNVTKARKVKYWNIGNEPDWHYKMTNALDIANYFKPIASALKQVDPTILIFGPDCAWYNDGLLSGLIGGSADITGKDANGHYYLDGVTWHNYPYSTGTYTRDQVVTAAPQTFRNNIASVKTLINAANTKNGRTGANALQWGIGEFNITTANPTSNTLDGVGVHSFLNGQYWAEYFGIAAANGATYAAPWSIQESGGDRSTYDLGYLDNNTTFAPRSSYYHLQMMSDYVNGTLLTATSNRANVKVVSSRDAATIAVVLLNEEQSGDLAYTVQLQTGMTTPSTSLQIVVNAAVAKSATGTLPSQYTRVLVFGLDGSLQKQIDFGMTAHAANNLPPLVTLFSSTTQSSSTQSSSTQSSSSTSLSSSSQGATAVLANEATRFVGVHTTTLSSDGFVRDLVSNRWTEVYDINGHLLGRSVSDSRGTVHLKIQSARIVLVRQTNPE